MPSMELRMSLPEAILCYVKTGTKCLSVQCEACDATYFGIVALPAPFSI